MGFCLRFDFDSILSSMRLILFGFLFHPILSYFIFSFFDAVFFLRGLRNCVNRLYELT